MRILMALFLVCSSVFASDKPNTIETDSSEKISISSVDLNNSEYRIKLFEPNHKVYMWYIGGTIDKDYDNFGKIVRINGFTNLGIEF